MELRQLEYFLMVSKLKSFTRAAEHLYISQPAVTNAIRSLEEELGIQLFDRSQKQIVLTTEGDVFYHHIDHIMDGVSKTLLDINNLKNLHRGSLTIGLTSFGILDIGAKLLQKFTEAYPHINIRIIEKDALSLQRDLLTENIDLAFLFTVNNDSLKKFLLANNELVLCCNNTHKFHYNNSIEWSSLSKEKIILLDDSSFCNLYINEYIDKITPPPQTILRLKHFQTIKSLISNNLGISILPRKFCETDTKLVSISFFPQIFLPLYLTYKKTRIKSHAVQAFIRFTQNFIEGGNKNL